MSPHIVSFGKGKTSKTKFDALEGSNSAIALTIFTGRSPEILIQDLTNNYETEFIKEFKAQLEARLNEVVDMSNVKFRREFDLMY